MSTPDPGALAPSLVEFWGAVHALLDSVGLDTEDMDDAHGVQHPDTVLAALLRSGFRLGTGDEIEAGAQLAAEQCRIVADKLNDLAAAAKPGGTVATS